VSISPFGGPLFIVGLPRSGTKLLRDLLNQNPRFSIPEAETQFIPYFVRKYGTPPPFDQRHIFDSFCGELQRSTFFRYMQERGFTFSGQALAQAADLRDWSSIIESLLRSFGPRPEARDAIFGDKTPRYLEAMGLLKEIFPAARFLHIIRDPRDSSLSAWRAWGLHPYGVAQRWLESLESQRKVGSRLGDYMELRYEDLITNAEATLRNVCRFLGCSFVPQMLRLSRSNENTGAAREKTEIISDNMNKYWHGLSTRQIRRIEEITFDQMIDLGYDIHLADRSRQLSDAAQFVVEKRNSMAFLLWKVESRGLKETVQYVMTRGARRP
jgi:hypothetical protein